MFSVDEIKDTSVTEMSRSRLRCCVCFCAHGDASLKQGSVLQLSDTTGGDAPDDLVYLCLPHSDCVEAAKDEGGRHTALRSQRDRLRWAIEQSDADFRRNRAPAGILSVAVAGHYLRNDSICSAELLVRLLSHERVHVVGEALWRSEAPVQVNRAVINGEASLQGSVALFVDRVGEADRRYLAHFTFEREGLSIQEKNPVAYFHFNACFSGWYVKVL